MDYRFLAAAAVTALAVAGAAHAADPPYSVTATQNSSYSVPVGQQVVVDFDNPPAAGYSDTGFNVASAGAPGQAGINQAPAGDSSAYGYVTAPVAPANSSPGTLTLATPSSSFSLLWGSIDSYNSISFFNGTTQVGNTFSFSSDSDQIGNTDLVNFSFTQPITSVDFASSQNSFEVDDLAVDGVSAAPEPGAWALMLGGVAALGLALRANRRRNSTGAFA